MNLPVQVILYNFSTSYDKNHLSTISALNPPDVELVAFCFVFLFVSVKFSNFPCVCLIKDRLLKNHQGNMEPFSFVSDLVSNRMAFFQVGHLLIY